MGNKLSRRQMLGTIGASAAAPLIGAVGIADASPTVSASIPSTIAATAVTRLGMYAEIDRLSQGAAHSWLKDFAEPVDKLISLELVSVDTTPLQYDPCSFESLLVTAGERLDVCLMRRQDIVDLLDRAVRQALGHELFEKLRAEDDRLESASSLVEQSKLAKTSAEDAAREFGGASADQKLTQGMKHSARGAARIAADAEARESERLAALKTKAALQREHAEMLRSFSTSPGHAINYEQRAKRVMTLLVDDVKEAYLKIVAAQAGLKECLGLDIPLPSLAYTNAQVRQGSEPQWAPSNPLDALVLWSRDAVRKLESLYAKEVTVTIKVPLVQKYSRDGTSDPASNLANRSYMIQQFDLGGKDLGKAPFELNLDDSYFLGIKNPRLLAIGARIVPLDQNTYNNQAALACRLLVDVPARSPGAQYHGAPRRSLLLGDVTREESLMQTAEAIRNANPRGKWYVKVLRGMFNYGESAANRDLIGDIRLEVQIAGQLDAGAV